MIENQITEAEQQLKKADKRARKLLRAARKGGRGAAGLAQAGADMQWAVMQERATMAKEARLVDFLNHLLAQLLPVLDRAHERKAAPPEPVLNPGGLAPEDIMAGMPREMQIHLDIRRLSGERTKAEPKERAEIELQLNELRDEFLAIRRAQAAPMVANYSCEVHRLAAEQLAAVLLDLEMSDGPSEALEATRDRLGALLQRLAEQRGLNELKAAMWPGAAD